MVRKPTHSPLLRQGFFAQWSVGDRSRLAAPVLMNSKIERERDEEKISISTNYFHNFCHNNLVHRNNSIVQWTKFYKYHHFYMDWPFHRHLNRLLDRWKWSIIGEPLVVMGDFVAELNRDEVGDRFGRTALALVVVTNAEIAPPSPGFFVVVDLSFFLVKNRLMVSITSKTMQKTVEIESNDRKNNEDRTITSIFNEIILEIIIAGSFTIDGNNEKEQSQSKTE